MPLPRRSFWPDPTARHYVRLALAVIAAPVALGAVLSVITYLIIGLADPDSAQGAEKLTGAAYGFFVLLPAFTLSFGIVGLALLWALGRRSVTAWAIAGAGTGAVAAAAGLLGGTGVEASKVVTAAALGLSLFLVIRWFAGVRSG